MKQRSGRRGALFTLLALAALALAFATILPRALERIRYPVKYKAQIIEVSQARDVPAALLAAIALTESGYDPGARSSMGALGLMQIMPDTGAWIAGMLGEDAVYAQDMLFDAAHSLSYGGWYLNFLLERYSGDITCAIAAYHAGQGSVDMWFAGGALNIPETAPNTRHYVSKVQSAYEYYQKVYDENI